MAHDGVNFIGVALGDPGMGKSHLLSRWGVQWQRRLIIDPVGEYVDQVPGAVTAWTLREAARALRRAIVSPTWTVIACLPPDVSLELLSAILPDGNPRTSVAWQTGGLAIQCDEIDTLAPSGPPSGMHPAVQNILQRGRHYRTSALFAARRPQDVNRVVTSFAHVVALFGMREPATLDDIAKRTSREVSDAVRVLPERHHIAYYRSGRAEFVRPSGRATPLPRR